jgi:hypothetical protein
MVICGPRCLAHDPGPIPQYNTIERLDFGSLRVSDASGQSIGAR